MIDERIIPYVAKGEERVIIADYVQDVLIGAIKQSEGAREGVLKSSHRSLGLLLGGSFSSDVIRVMDIYEPEQFQTARHISFQPQPLQLLLKSIEGLGQQLVGLAKFDMYDGRAEIKIHPEIGKMLERENVLQDRNSGNGAFIEVFEAGEYNRSVILSTLERKARFYREGPFYVGKNSVFSQRGKLSRIGLR